VLAAVTPHALYTHLQHVCKYACSEEVPEPVDVGGEGFCVAFDPLDGSSIVDTNFAVGTIFGVWPGEKLKDISGREQVGFIVLVKCWHSFCFLQMYL
jgi:fructose-1,6-bisphosphatase